MHRKMIRINSTVILDNRTVFPKGAGNQARLRLVKLCGDLETVILNHVETLVREVKQRIHRIEEFVAAYLVKMHDSPSSKSIKTDTC